MINAINAIASNLSAYEPGNTDQTTIPSSTRLCAVYSTPPEDLCSGSLFSEGAVDESGSTKVQLMSTSFV